MKNKENLDFEKIYLKYFDSVYGFIMKLTGGDSQLTEELTQETFCQAWVSLGKFRGNCSLGTWLCQIAKNCFLKYLRKNKETLIEISSDLDSMLNTENTIITQEEKAALRRGILSLKPKQRDVILLRLYLDMSYEEISKVTGIKQDTAKVLFQRGKASLIKKLRQP